MPSIHLDQFKQRRQENSNYNYASHVKPQMQYLAANLNEVLKNLRKEKPRDERVTKLQNIVDAINGLADAGRFTRDTTAEKYLETMGGLPELLEANDGELFKRLQKSMETNADLKKKLPQDDQSKTVFHHLADLNNFFDWGYANQIADREIAPYIARMKEKRDEVDAESGVAGVKFNAITSSSMSAVEKLLREASNQFNPNHPRAREFTEMAEALETFGKSARVPVSEDQQKASLKKIAGLGDLLKKDGNLRLLQDTLKNSKELSGDLGFKSKTVVQHVMVLDDFFELNYGPELKKLRDKEIEQQKKEEERKQEEYEQKLDDEDARQVEQQKKAILKEEEDEKQREKEQAQQKKQQEANAAREREEFRKNNGAFVLPPEYDNRDAAGMLLTSAKQNGDQYKALQNFSKELDKSIQQWDEYYAQEYIKREPQALKDLPEQPTEEQRSQAVDDALNSVSAEERKALVQSYFKYDYEDRVAAERKKLGSNSSVEQAERSLYRQAVTEQYRNDLRNKTFTVDKIQKAERDARLELARDKISKMNQEELQKLEAVRNRKRDEVIARRIRSQILEGYREKKEAFLNAYFPNTRTEDDFLNKHPRLRVEIHKNKRDRGDVLYEGKMNELLDFAMDKKEDWDGFHFNLKKYLPNAFKSPDEKKGPLDICLERAQNDPLTDQLAEEETLLYLVEDSPREEIEHATDKQLGLQGADEGYLYTWARDRKKEQLRETIRKEREEKFPELGKAGSEKLKTMQTEAHRILSACAQVEPGKNENFLNAIDYKAEIEKDPNLEEKDRKLLLDALKNREYEKYLTENMKDDPENKKTLTSYQQMQLNRIATKAVERSMMSPKQRREEEKKERHADLEKKLGEHKLKAYIKQRKQKAKEELRNRTDAAKNKKLEGKLEGIGDAVGSLRDGLLSSNLSEGELGKAYRDLDKAWTQGDLQKGKELRKTMKVAPEPKAQQKGNPVPPAQAKQEDGAVSFDGKVHMFPLKAAKRPIRAPFAFSKDYDAYWAKLNPKVQPNGEEPDNEEDLNTTKIDLDGDLIENRDDAARKKMNQYWTSAKGRHVKKEDRRAYLSTLLATHLLNKKANEENAQNDPTEAEIKAEAERIKGSAAFEELFQKGAPNYLAQETPDGMIEAYQEKVKKIEKYRLNEQQQSRRAARLDPVMTDLENTKSGKIIKYIPRAPLGNSSGYDNALAAIRTVKNAPGGASAEEAYRSTQIVLKYLHDKEKVRKRAFGRQRWNDCMTFLKETMPPEEFKKYCDKVNEKRGLTDHPEHSDYVSPERFGSAQLKVAREEAKDLLDRGGGRTEDLATVLALSRMKDDPVNKTELTQLKNQILSNPEFQKIVDKKLPEMEDKIKRTLSGQDKWTYLKENEKKIFPEAQVQQGNVELNVS